MKQHNLNVLKMVSKIKLKEATTFKCVEELSWFLREKIYNNIVM